MPRCSGCDDNFDLEELTSCLHCDALICEECQRLCDDCGADICVSCCYTCNICGNTLCCDCVRACVDCDNVTCSSCSCHCPECGHECCETCYQEGCSQCEGLGDTDADETRVRGVRMNEYNKNPYLLDYGTTPSWKCYKKSWEKPHYMGMELEIENIDSFDEMLKIPSKFMEGRFIWKRDASIGEENCDGRVVGGAELVLAPHTRQELIDIDWKGMLKELRLIGSSSYTNGRCGLHIHVSRQALSETQIRRILAFTSANSEKLRKFGQRTKGNMNRWSPIPDNWKSWNDSFYGGLVPIGGVLSSQRAYVTASKKGTIEFRGFRGTLNLARLRATIDFIDTLVAFSDCHGTPICASDRSWAAFLDFAQQTGRKYLIEQLNKVPFNYEKLTSVHAAEVLTAESEE